MMQARLLAARDTQSASQDFLVIEGERLRYGAFNDRLDRLTALFREKGLTTGSTIAILTTSGVHASLLLIGAMRTGIAPVALNAELTPVERRSALAALAPDHVFVDQAILDDAPLPQDLAITAIKPKAKPGGGLIGRLLKSRATSEAPSGLDAELDAIEPDTSVETVDEDAIGLMLFTSGTTSTPKIVQLSHRNLGAQIEAFDAVYDYDRDSRVLNLLPMHFTDGILHGPVYAYLKGATLFRPGKFEIGKIEDTLHSIYRDRITHLILVPAILSIIDRLHDSFNDAFDTPDFRNIRSSGDRLPEQLWTSVEDRFGVRVVNTYGLSETVCEATYCGPADALYKRGTIGKPVGCELRLADESGQEVAEGESGELLIRGDIIMQGYKDQPELTAEAIRDGWFHTGDLATLDPDGFATIIGRRKTLIISGGVNIHPQEITDTLTEHAAIAEAVTFGLPDPVWGEVVACVVELAKGVETLPEADVRAHCQARLAPHKLPRRLVAVEAIPRNPAGKVLIGELEQLVRAAASSGGAQADGSLDERLRTVAASVFGCKPEDLRMTSDNRNTFGWDSLAHMNLIFATEEHFGIKLSPRDILSISRLEHLRDVVAAHLEETAS